MSLGIREYARHRKAAGLPGGTAKAVREAIKTGRLATSLAADKKQIADAAAADAEWDATTNADMVPASGPTAPAASSKVAPSPLAEHRARHADASATLAELELEEKRGQLVRVEDVETRWADIVTILRTKLLGLPARLRQRDPSVTSKQVAAVDALIRDALEELAVDAGF